MAIGHKHGENLFIRNSARKYFERQGIGACSNGLKKENNSCDSVCHSCRDYEVMI